MGQNLNNLLVEFPNGKVELKWWDYILGVIFVGVSACVLYKTDTAVSIHNKELDIQSRNSKN